MLILCDILIKKWDKGVRMGTVYYEDARKSIIEFFEIEFPALNYKEVERYINFFYKLSNYEEEGTKIRPDIFIANNINAVVRTIPDCRKIMMYQDADSTNFKQRIKALMCFCKKEWNLYVNYTESGVEYGLIKAINSLKDKTIRQLIFDKNYSDLLYKKTSLININVVSGGLVILKGIKGNKTSICFNLSNQFEYEWEETIQRFVDAILSKLKTTPRKLDSIKNLYSNIFQKAFKGLHGTICLVVDKEFKDNKGFLEDGTWLKEPIEFGKLFLKSKVVDENRLSSYSDVLVTMLDYDGITILDNAGRIRAYNVFIESDAKVSQNVIGGARRRAAYTLLESKNKKVIGVYFQSQDGDNFYQNTKGGKKKPVKIKVESVTLNPVDSSQNTFTQLEMPTETPVEQETIEKISEGVVNNDIKE